MAEKKNQLKYQRGIGHPAIEEKKKTRQKTLHHVEEKSKWKSKSKPLGVKKNVGTSEMFITPGEIGNNRKKA